MKKLMKLRAANDQLLKQIHGLDHNYTETVVHIYAVLCPKTLTQLNMPSAIC